MCGVRGMGRLGYQEEGRDNRFSSHSTGVFYIQNYSSNI